jgi:hypothetical protein
MERGLFTIYYDTAHDLDMDKDIDGHDIDTGTWDGEKRQISKCWNRNIDRLRVVVSKYNRTFV